MYSEIEIWKESYFTAVAGLKQECNPALILRPQHSIKHLNIDDRDKIEVMMIIIILMILMMMMLMMMITTERHLQVRWVKGGKRKNLGTLT